VAAVALSALQQPVAAAGFLPLNVLRESSKASWSWNLLSLEYFFVDAEKLLQ
jgi:hypothetical protein